MLFFCVFCQSTSTSTFSVSDKLFYRCNSCGGYFLDSSHFLDLPAQKARYSLHHNTLDNNAGYRSYLARCIDPVLDFLSNKDFNVTSILDYGSGPYPSMVQLLKEYAACGRLENAVQITYWDPLFAPDRSCFNEKADLVICLEVAEHFECPLKDFLSLADSCREGGYIALGTQFVTENIDFNSWWYKEDPTHTTFYSEKSLCATARHVGLLPMGFVSPSMYMLYKE